MFDETNSLEKLEMFCPLQEVSNIITRKWTLLILNEIGNHNYIRFNELKRELRTITSKSLSNILGNLEEEKLVTKKIFIQIPSKVEYRLTDEGYRLYQIILQFISWSTSRARSEIKKCSCNIIAQNTI